MFELILYFDCILCVIDLVTISSLRRFLFDFLISAKNRKSALKLHTQQALKDRISYGYIYSHLKKNQKVFATYQKLYILVLYTIIPQYIILIACNITISINSLYVFALFALIKLGVALLVRMQTDSNLISKYRKKK